MVVRLSVTITDKNDKENRIKREMAKENKKSQRTADNRSGEDDDVIDKSGARELRGDCSPRSRSIHHDTVMMAANKKRNNKNQKKGGRKRPQ